MEEWLHHFEHHSEYFIVDIRYLSKVLFRFPGVGKVGGGGGGLDDTMNIKILDDTMNIKILDDTMNIKIRYMGKCTGKSYGEIGIYRTWLLFSNISKFVFFRN